MKYSAEILSGRGKYVIAAAVIAAILGAIYIYNGMILDDSSIVRKEDGLYLEASGSVESSSIIISSEVSGSVIEVKAKEGEMVKSGQAVAVIENTALESQYQRMKSSLDSALQNVASLEDALKDYSVHNEKLISQAHSTYMAAEAEYQKVRDGASAEEISQAREAVKQADINRAHMKAALERSRVLLEAQGISQTDYDEAERSHELAESQYSSAVSRLELLESMPTDSNLKIAQSRMQQAKSGHELAISGGRMHISELENQLASAGIQAEQAKKELIQAEAELEKTFIRSPADGVLSSVFFDKGEFVTAGKPAIEIYDSSAAQIQVYVSEADIGHIKTGQEAKLYVDSHADEVFGGKVVQISSEAEFTPKNIQTKAERVNTVFRVRIEADDSGGVIKPGMPVDVNIKIDEAKGDPQ